MLSQADVLGACSPRRSRKRGRRERRGAAVTSTPCSHPASPQPAPSQPRGTMPVPAGCRGSPSTTELQAEGPGHGRHIPEAGRVGSWEGLPCSGATRAPGHRSCGERGLRPEGAERALAAHRGRCQHVSPASEDRGQCVCVGEHRQHSLRSWQRAGCEHSGCAGLGTARSLRGTDGAGLLQVSCPGGGRDAADQVHSTPRSSLPAAAKTTSGPGCGSADSEG